GASPRSLRCASGVRFHRPRGVPVRRATIPAPAPAGDPPMIDEVFHIGSFSISPFGLMLVFAFLASYFQLRGGMQRLGIGDEEDASALIFAAGVGGIVGAKVYY